MVSVNLLNEVKSSEVKNNGSEKSKTEAIQLAASANIVSAGALEIVGNALDMAQHTLKPTSEDWTIDAPFAQNIMEKGYKIKKEMNVTDKEYKKVDVNAIFYNVSDNPRKKYGDLQALADSIRKNGLQNPVVIKLRKDGKGYDLIHGFRRMEAVTIANKDGASIARIEAIIVDEKTATLEYGLTKHFIDNQYGKALTPLEESEVFYRLETLCGWSRSEIADKIGKTESHVSALLQLYHQDEEVKTMVEEGTVSATTVSKVTKAAIAQAKAETPKTSGNTKNAKSGKAIIQNKAKEIVKTELKKAAEKAKSTSDKKVTEDKVSILKDKKVTKSLTKLEELISVLNNKSLFKGDNKDRKELLEAVVMFLKDDSISVDEFIKAFFK